MSRNDIAQPENQALNLLDRPPPEGYVEQWTQLLAEAREEDRQDTTAVVVFRLGAEWMALPCSVFREFTGAGKIHRIPHRSDAVLLGICNIRGELQLAVSLHALLEIDTAGEKPETRAGRLFQRMAVLLKDGETFVAPVDEVAGLHRVAESEIETAPVTVTRASATHTRGVFRLGDKPVSLLEDELLFSNLRRHVE